nr:hypothetical protein [Tanacetum cinerariifolium]
MFVIKSFRERNKKTSNNDKNLSEVQLEHEKEDEFVVVVVKEVHELKVIVSRLLEKEGKLELWFKQDTDKEEERFEEDEDGGEMKKRLFEKKKRSWGEMIHHHFHQSWQQVEVMRNDDLEWNQRKELSIKGQDQNGKMVLELGLGYK